jgi:hypothetical protein
MSLLAGCSIHSPGPGEEIVLVQKPWIFGHGGVVDEPVKTGLSVTAFSTWGVEVFVQPKAYEIDMADIMTSDGVPLSFHSVLVLQVTDSVGLIKHFGADWYQNNVANPYAKIVRQAVRKHGMNETAISTVAVDEIDHEIMLNMQQLLKDLKLPVLVVQSSIGKANPPDAVKNQRIETASQQQRIQTEQQKRLAEDQRKAAEVARASADNAYREAMHLSPEQFIELQRINMLKEACVKGACTFINSGVTPVLDVSKK